MEKLCMVRSFMFLLTPCMNFSALFNFLKSTNLERHFIPERAQRKITHQIISEWFDVTICLNLSEKKHRMQSKREMGATGKKSWRGSIFVSFKIHSDTKHTHTNQKTQAKYTNASPDHNHLWLDKTALMICGWIYCKQTLLIRFLQYCLRFQWKIVLLQTLSSLWYSHALVSAVGFGEPI